MRKTRLTTQKPSQETTTGPIQVPNQNKVTPQAEFLRLPKPKTLDPIYGLSRSAWNELLLPCAANNYRPPIVSISYRKKGKMRGTRLIVADSARAYFNALLAEVNKERGNE